MLHSRQVGLQLCISLAASTTICYAALQGLVLQWTGYTLHELAFFQLLHLCLLVAQLLKSNNCLKSLNIDLDGNTYAAKLLVYCVCLRLSSGKHATGCA